MRAILVLAAILLAGCGPGPSAQAQRCDQVAWLRDAAVAQPVPRDGFGERQLRQAIDAIEKAYDAECEPGYQPKWSGACSDVIAEGYRYRLCKTRRLRN